MSGLNKEVASRHKLFKNWVYGAGGADRVGRLTDVDPSTIHKYLRGDLEVPKLFICLINEGIKYSASRTENAQLKRELKTQADEIERIIKRMVKAESELDLTWYAISCHDCVGDIKKSYGEVLNKLEGGE